MAPLDAPLGFRCVADDCMHAEEQCENANPGCDIVWVAITDSIGPSIGRQTMSEFVYHADGTLPSVDDDMIFVFGSNLAGRHGGGAARVAHRLFGAAMGSGRGFVGEFAYAIPTKDESIQTLPLDEIAMYVDEFVRETHQSDVRFFVTRVGCGLAGYDDADVAPLFRGCNPAMVSMPEPWRDYLED
jgi:hypothetical protein